MRVEGEKCYTRGGKKKQINHFSTTCKNKNVWKYRKKIPFKQHIIPSLELCDMKTHLNKKIIIKS